MGLALILCRHALIRVDAEVNKWRVAAWYGVFSLVLLLAVIWYTRNWPAGNHGYDYLAHGPSWHVIGWEVSIAFLGALIVWRTSPKLQARVRRDVSTISDFIGKARDIYKLPVPSPAEQELDVWSGAYKKRPQVAKYAVERRKRA